jgi:hypothetical protein
MGVRIAIARSCMETDQMDKGVCGLRNAKAASKCSISKASQMMELTVYAHNLRPFVIGLRRPARRVAKCTYFQAIPRPIISAISVGSSRTDLLFSRPGSCSLVHCRVGVSRSATVTVCEIGHHFNALGCSLCFRFLFADRICYEVSSYEPRRCLSPRPLPTSEHSYPYVTHLHPLAI